MDTRYLGITGGILIGFGIITASFASHIEIMIVCISIINGMSFSFSVNSLSLSNCLLYIISSSNCLPNKNWLDI